MKLYQNDDRIAKYFLARQYKFSGAGNMIVIPALSMCNGEE